MNAFRATFALGTLAAFITGIVVLVRVPTRWMRTQGTGMPTPAIPGLHILNPSPTPTMAMTTTDFVGPRENIPDDAPSAYGFWSFAMPVSRVFSRSGQPLMSEFSWLKEQGWTSVVNLRTDGERGEIGDDAKLPGFSSLGLTYLHLPLADGHPPTEKQAEQFLAFVTNPANQPVHVHCRGGIGRAGTMTALYRYAVQGWPLELAIQESRAFRGGISTAQAAWLQQWAEKHPPRSHATP